MPLVLLLDDDRHTLEIVGNVLRSSGFEVTCASTGRDALAVAQRRRVDFVVADLWLADMTGLDVLNQLRHRLTHAPFVLIIDLAATAASFESELPDAAVEKPPFGRRLVDLLQSHLVDARSPSMAGRTRRANPQAIHALSVIEARFADANLSVRAIARDLGVSTEHLCRLVKRQTGHTFLTLLRGARVRAACQLLDETTLSMKEIADRVGFGDGSRFARDFKKVCGSAPSQYRNRIVPSHIPRPDINFVQAISTNRKP